ncbi:MAG: hypothetical protein ACFCUI_00455 [Bernardetiaceae bacterium]
MKASKHTPHTPAAQSEVFENMLRPNYQIFCGDISGVTQKGETPAEESHGALVARMRRAETRICQKLNPDQKKPDELSLHIARQIEEVAQVTATRFCRYPMLCQSPLNPDHYPPLHQPAFLEMTGRIRHPEKKNPVVSVEVYLEEIYSGVRKKMWEHEFVFYAQEPL